MHVFIGFRSVLLEHVTERCVRATLTGETGIDSDWGLNTSAVVSNIMTTTTTMTITIQPHYIV